MKRLKRWATPLILLSCAVLAACNSSGDNAQHAAHGGSDSVSHAGGAGSAGAGSAGAGSAGSRLGRGRLGWEQARPGQARLGRLGWGLRRRDRSPPLAAGRASAVASSSQRKLALGLRSARRTMSKRTMRIWRLAAHCLPRFALTWRAAPASTFERCTQSLSSCSAIVEHRGVPSWCWQPRGAAPLGGPCSNDMECDQGLCQREKGAPAGACAPPQPAGASCESPLRCAIGLRCSPPDYVCIVPAADGQNCRSSLDCSAGSTCDGEHCNPSQVGDRCSDGLIPCAPAQTCLLDQCAQLPNADETHSCLAGFQCSGTKRCAVQQTEQLERTGDCREAATVGAACDTRTPCLEPLTCRSGKCRP